MAIKGTELFVKALRAEGVDTVFGYPGGMAIDLFDALYSANDIDVILPRHEQALIHEADGVFLLRTDFGACHLKLRKIEERVVAKTVRSADFMRDVTLHCAGHGAAFEQVCGRV